MDFNDKGQLISEFRPPRDEHGNGLCYEDYRAFIGVPMTREEIDAGRALRVARRAHDEATEHAYRIANRCSHPMCGLGHAHAGEHNRRQARDHRVKA